MNLMEFTKITGYSPVTVAQAMLYKPERRAAKLAEQMGVYEERSVLVGYAVSSKSRNKRIAKSLASVATNNDERQETADERNKPAKTETTQAKKGETNAAQ